MLYSEGVHAADAIRRTGELPISLTHFHIYCAMHVCTCVCIREYVACVSVQHKHFAGMPTVQMHAATELGWQRSLLVYATYVACLSAKNNQ